MPILYGIWPDIYTKAWGSESSDAISWAASKGRFYTYPDRKVHGANMGPTWHQQDSIGTHVCHVNFAIWVVLAVKYIFRLNTPSIIGKIDVSYWNDPRRFLALALNVSRFEYND